MNDNLLSLHFITLTLMYLLIATETSIVSRRRARWTNWTFFEVISWKSEELPAAMKKFFSLAGASEGGNSPEVSDVESSEYSESEEMPPCSVS